MQFTTVWLECPENAKGLSKKEATATEELPDTTEKHVWKYEEVAALIRSMANHYEDLGHAKTSKNVFKLVSLDLMSEGFTCSANLCLLKWKSLVRSYTHAKENLNKKGRGRRFQFFWEMDSILNAEPSVKCISSMGRLNNVGDSVFEIDVNCNSDVGDDISTEENFDYEESKTNVSQDSLDAPSKRIWKHSETVALIESMSNHYENLSNTKKKIHVFESISNDLINEGIDCDTNLCLLKWKSLVRSYNQAKKNKTGKRPGRFQFFNEMDAILGSKEPDKQIYTMDSFCKLEESVFEPDTHHNNSDVEDNVSISEYEILYENPEHNQESSKPNKKQCVSQEKSGKRIWKYSETAALIKIMRYHYDSLRRADRKIHVFELVSHDLLNEGIACDANVCLMKWKSLVRSYNQAKDNECKTGKGPGRFQFYNEMDSILGANSIPAYVYALDCNDSMEYCLGTSEHETEINHEQPVKISYKRKKTDKKEHEDNRNKRHQERMDIEKMKIEIEKEKINLLKKYLESRNS